MKKLSLFVILIFCVFFMAGCGLGDPVKFTESYFQDIKDKRYEDAFNKLSAETQGRFSKEQFLSYLELKSEASDTTEVTVEKLSEEKDKEVLLGETKYKTIAQLKITEKILDKYSNEEQTLEYELFAVEENGVWKIHRGLEKGKDVLAQAYNSVGKMYYEGKGKEKDLNKAAEIFAEGIESGGNYNDNYIYLAQTYYYLGKYSQAMEQCDKYISKSTNNSQKSNAYNLKGLCYAKMGNDKKAKKMYEQALALDPSNKAAQLNLDYYSTVKPIVPIIPYY